MKRTLSLILVLAMMLTAMLGVISFADAAPAAETPELDISDATLQFASAVYIYVAVDYSDFDSAEGVTLKVTNNKTGDSTILQPNKSVTAPTNCVAFKYTALGSKNMGDELTLQAMKDGVASGSSKTYSVLEYALKAQAQGDAKLTALMQAMLKYGADSQTAFNHPGSYDLKKSYSLVKVGGIGSVNGKTKTIVETGTAVSVTASASDAVWYTSAVQRQGVGASISVNTAKPYQALYAVPKSVANSESYELDMDKYTGNATLDVNTPKADIGGTLSWLNQSSFTGTATGKLELKNGYIKWNNGNGLNFNSAAVADAISESVSDYAKAVVAGTSTEGLNSVFTISITLAADENSSSLFTRWHIRNGKNATITTANAETAAKDSTPFATTAGRLSFLQSNGTMLKPMYNAAASTTVTATSGTWKNVLPTLSKGQNGEPGEFVTIHMVIDLSGEDTCPICKGAESAVASCASCGKDGKASTIKYYVGESATPLITTINPVPVLYFTTIAGGYLNGENGNGVGYLKAFTVTNGNFTDFFK